MPLQKSSGVAILVSLQECGFFLHITVQRRTNSRKQQVKINWTFSFQVDASAVNLRLQYSSYFLFVMVITCVLYGMIKGRPVKQNYNKKVHEPDSCVEWEYCRAACNGFQRYVNFLSFSVDWFQCCGVSSHVLKAVNSHSILCLEL